jgi:acetylornithine deacetylase/succinyl-diaminopimelate desuccinylase-like protein
VDKVYPAWALPEDHVLVQAGQEAARTANGRSADLGRWAFSTNGTYWMGKAGIPSIGFGPGDERYAHTTLDQVPLDEVIASARFYALLPLTLGSMLLDDATGKRDSAGPGKQSP